MRSLCPGSAALALALALSPMPARAQRRALLPEVDFLTPGVGRVAVLLRSDRPQLLALMRSRSVEADSPESRWSGSATCTTPCRVFVPPGPLHLRTSGAGQRWAEFDLEVPDGPTEVTLRTSSARLFNLGTGLVAAGSVAFLAATVVGLVRQSTAPANETALPTAALLPIGGLILGLLGVGVPLMVTNRTGVARRRPMAPEGL